MNGGTLPGSAWPDAEAAFRGDPRWVGGDDAYSIDLHDGRRLWLFGDSFVARDGGSRADAAFVHNTIAIQYGDDLTSANMEFLWAGTDDEPTSFFPDGDDGSYLWPGHGIRIDNALLLFFMRVRDVPDPSPDLETLTFFDAFSWEAALVDNVDAHPDGWILRWLDRPWSPKAALVAPGVVAHDGYLYAYAVRHPCAYLCRWPLEAAARGVLTGAAWWCGPRDGWVVDPTPETGTEPAVVLDPAESEFTVHRDPITGRFVHVQVAGLTEPRLEIRPAHRPEGPWSAPAVVDYRPADAGRGDRFFYAGKAHPGLRGPGLVVTHNAITFTLVGIREHDDLYRPRVVTVEMASSD